MRVKINPSALGAFAILLLAFVASGYSQEVFNLPIREAPGPQILPRVISATQGGGTFIIWVDQSLPQRGIAAQLLSADGIPVLETPRRFVEATGQIDDFDIAADGQGRFFLAVHQVSFQSNQVAVLAVEESGSVLWSKALNLPSVDRRVLLSRIAWDLHDGAYVVWEVETGPQNDGENAEVDLYAQHFNKEGAVLWGAAGVAITTKPKAQRLGDIVAMSTGLAVAWEDLAQRNNNVLFQVFDFATGDPLANPAGVPPKLINLNATSRPRLAKRSSNSDDSVFLVWEESTPQGKDLYGQRFTNNAGRLWGLSGKPVVTAKGNQFAHQVLDDGDGRLIVVWQQQGTNGDVDLFAQKLDGDGDPVWNTDGRPVIEAAGDQLNPRLSGDSNEGFFCVWESPGGDGIDLVAQHISRSGKLKWRDDGVVVSANPGAQERAAMITIAGDNAVIAWEDRRNGNADIFSQTISTDGVLLNLAPKIISVPPEFAAAGAAFSYQVEAFDYDRDVPFEYTLTQAPRWMKINTATGLVSGQVPSTAGTAVSVSILVMDSRGGDAMQEFQLIIVETNSPPVITSVPDTIALEDSVYNYVVRFTDPDSGDTHRLELIAAPKWLQNTEGAFQITGIPENADVGRHEVVLKVIDSAGAEAMQQFNIEVLNTNDPPNFLNVVTADSALEDSSYSYQLQAEDPDALDVLHFELLQAPAWLSLDADRQALAGTPRNADVGEANVTAVVRDAAGAADTLSYTLVVLNTNDPPQFISQPDTIAVVDSVYSYQFSVVDEDRGDQITIELKDGPPWLSLDAGRSVLQGTAPASAADRRVNVSLRAADLAGAEATQNFVIHVFKSAEADTTAPGKPVSFSVAPEAWSSAAEVLLTWQNPIDRSGIRDLFAKLGSAPVDTADYYFRRRVDGSSGQPDSAKVPIPLDGKMALYFWLSDHAGNVSIRNAAAVTVRIDRQPPEAPAALAPRNWSRSDSVTFRWKAARDTTSGIAEYVLSLLDGTWQEIIHPKSPGLDTLQVVAPLGLPDKSFRWQVAAIDSAGNSTASGILSFRTDTARPVIVHSLIDTADAAQDLVLQAQVTDVPSGVLAVEAWLRPADASRTERLALARQPASAVYSLAIAASQIDRRGLAYALVATDSAGNQTILQNTPDGAVFHSVSVRSRNNPAPAPTLGAKYQMVSVPFFTYDQSVKRFFEQNFGAYEETSWRLLRYQDGGYVEFNSDSLQDLAPGRAYWLITRSARTLTTGEVASIRTQTDFVLTLKPGWNMVATPFAFATDRNAVSMPAEVENAFWKFNGTNYQLENTALQPWSGYFIKNNAPAPRTITISPVPIGASAKRAVVNFERLAWVARLSASQRTGRDEANYFGIAEEAPGAEIFNISEPPAIGQTPRLYFKGTNGERSTELAADFRPASESGAVWRFSVENLVPGELELHLESEQAIPDSLRFILADEKAMIRNVLHTGSSLRMLVTGGEQRDFTLFLATPSMQEAAGLIPRTLQLYPVWPNPYAAGAGGSLVIRFDLETPSVVDLKIFNILGQLVWQAPEAAARQAGEHAVIWNGRDLQQHRVAAGVYIIALSRAGEIQRRKVMVIR